MESRFLKMELWSSGCVTVYSLTLFEALSFIPSGRISKQIYKLNRRAVACLQKFFILTHLFKASKTRRPSKGLVILKAT